MERRKFLKFLLTSGIVLTSTGSTGAFFYGCEKGKELRLEKVYDFLEHLNEAEVITPKKEYVKKTAFTISGEKREVLFEHPDSRVTFKNVPIYKNARLSFGIGINEPAWDKDGDGVLFEVILTDEKSKKHVIHSRYIDPKNNPEDRKWFDEMVGLESFEGKKVSFTFKTSAGQKNNDAFDWAGWSEPRLNAEKIVKLKGKKPSNIILISIDTLRPDRLGCYGHKMETSPFIDKLAGRGVLFKNAIAQSPWTLPSHMSILTSLYPSVHLANSKKNNKLSEEKVCLAEILKKEGYYTAAFVDGGWLRHKFGFNQGFDIYDDEGGRIARINKKVMKFLEENFQKKFFLFMHVYDVHGPYEPPPPYNEMFYKGNKDDPNNHSMDFIKSIGYHKYQKFDNITDINYVKSLYAGEIRYVDNELGKLFAKMGELEIFDNTLLVFLSDHGESLFEHHVYIGHGIFLFDNEVKIPLIIKPPKGNYRKRVIYNQVESIDVMPTILDLLDLPANKEAQGKSLVKFMKNQKVASKDNFAFGESSNTGGTGFVRTNKWKFISKMKINLNELVQGLKPSNKINLTKYIIDEEQLYDLENDPQERNNLIKKEPEVAKKLKDRLIKWEEDNKKIASRMEKHKIELTDEEKEQLKALGYVQ